MEASNLAMVLPVDLLKHIVDGFHEGNLVVLAWNWTDPLAQFRPLSSHNLSAHSEGWMFFFRFSSFDSLPTLPALSTSGFRPAAHVSDCLCDV